MTFLPPKTEQYILDIYMLRRYNSQTGFYEFSTGGTEPKWKSLKNGKIWRNSGHIKNHINMFKSGGVKVPDSYRNAHEIDIVCIRVDILGQLTSRVEKVCSVYDILIEEK